MSRQTGIASWLDREELPDFYCLLGRPRLDPDVDGLELAIHAATRELLPYQNHADAAKAQRAMRLMFELGRAEDLLADPRRLDEFNEKLTLELLVACRAHFNGQTQWREGAVSEWLESACGVHPSASRKTAALLLRSLRPVPLRVFGRPDAAQSDRAAENTADEGRRPKPQGSDAAESDFAVEDTHRDDLLTPIAADLLPPDLGAPSPWAPQPVPVSMPAAVWPSPWQAAVPAVAPLGAWPAQPVPVCPIAAIATAQEGIDLRLHLNTGSRPSKSRLLAALRVLVLVVLIAWLPAILFLAYYLSGGGDADVSPGTARKAWPAAEPRTRQLRRESSRAKTKSTSPGQEAVR